MTTLTSSPRRITAPTWTTVDTLALLRRLSGARDLSPELTLWLVLLGVDGTPTGIALPVPELPPRPDPWTAARALASVVERAEGDGLRLAVGYARRDGGSAGAVESAWSRTLHRAAAAQRVKIVTEVALGRDVVTLMSSPWLLAATG
jgi:hypothetical protein